MTSGTILGHINEEEKELLKRQLISEYDRQLASEHVNRRGELISHDSEKKLVATLYWMAENGNDLDLELIQWTQEKTSFSSESLDRLFENTRNSIKERIEKEAADRERIAKETDIYIKKSLDKLEERETIYRRFAYIWYVLGFMVLTTGIGAALWRVQYGLNGSIESDWPSFAQFALLMLVVIGLVWALAKYAFTLGKSFMVESLRNSDRVHAIRFGQFYLDAYSEKANWSEIKEAFQHWNIDSGSAFINQDSSQFDIDSINNALEIVVKALKKEKAVSS